MSFRAAAFLFFSVSLAATIAAQTPAPTAVPVRVAIAGTVHGHVTGFMRQIAGRPEMTLVGVWEPDAALREAFRTRYSIPADQMFATLDDLLARAKPEAVASFSSTKDHRPIVEAAAARGVHVMVEKPLAVSNADARAIEQAAAKGRIHVITNYETTWYPSHRAIWQLLKEQKAGGALRKIVVLDGHEGPKEINVQPEFMKWLGDPVANGAGALFDFGCYGANLMTWLMDGQRPVAVTAITQRFKPDKYPNVDDEATILIEYPGALRKIVVLDGHEGPKEINVQPEFMKWLGDPVENGAGALFDFGCYGANLMTWLMDGQRPIAVTAVTQRFKPEKYPNVDDEATILIEYPGAQGIAQASWNWPFGRKDLEVYAERAYAIATGPNSVRQRVPGGTETAGTPVPWPPDERDYVSYLTAVVRGRLAPSGLSGLANNLVVVEILDAARESAKTGKRVVLPVK